MPSHPRPFPMGNRPSASNRGLYVPQRLLHAVPRRARPTAANAARLSCRETGMSGAARCCGPSASTDTNHIRGKRLRAAARLLRDMRRRLAQTKQTLCFAGTSDLSAEETDALTQDLADICVGFEEASALCEELLHHGVGEGGETRREVLTLQAEALYCLGEVFEIPQTPLPGGGMRRGQTGMKLAIQQYTASATLCRIADNPAAEKRSLERTLILSVQRDCPSRDIRRCIRLAERLCVLMPTSTAAPRNLELLRAVAVPASTGGVGSDGWEDHAQRIQGHTQITGLGREVVLGMVF